MDNRMAKIKFIYERLSSLESQREEARINGESTDSIDLEISSLRELLQSIVNNLNSIK